MNHEAPLSEVVSKALASVRPSEGQIESRPGTATPPPELPANFTLAELERIAALVGIRTSELVARSEAAE